MCVLCVNKAVQFINTAMAALLRVSLSYVEMLRGGKRTASGTVWRVIEQAEKLKLLKFK